MLLEQIASLPDEIAVALTDMFCKQLASHKLTNPVGWMFSMLRRARNGELNLPEIAGNGFPAAAGTHSPTRIPRGYSPPPAASQPAKKASQEKVRAVIAAIRKQTS